MKEISTLRACRDGLLALSDPDLLLLVQQWIETRSWVPENANFPTVQESVDNQLCLLLGYAVHSLKTGRLYPSLPAFLEVEAPLLGYRGACYDGNYDLFPPPVEELRRGLAAMSLDAFSRTIIDLAFSAPPLGCAGDFKDPDLAFLSWLSQAIHERSLLERDRPGCLFYCIGYRLGLLPVGLAPFPTDEAELTSLLLEVWEHYVRHLVRQLESFIETEEELQPFFLIWSRRGVHDACSSRYGGTALEIVSLLCEQAPAAALLAPAASEIPTGLAALEAVRKGF